MQCVNTYLTLVDSQKNDYLHHSALIRKSKNNKIYSLTSSNECYQEDSFKFLPYISPKTYPSPYLHDAELRYDLQRTNVLNNFIFMPFYTIYLFV